MKYFLGANVFVHDAAFYLLDEKADLVFAIEEEKIIKNRYQLTSSYFALDYMLEREGINKEDIVEVGLSFSFKEFEKVFEIHNSLYGKEMSGRHRQVVESHFRWRNNLISSIGLTSARVSEVGHHLCHALSAFSLSEFDSAAVISIDGNGENDTLAIYHATGKEMIKKARVLRPHSLGWLWTYVTEWLKLGTLGNEGKTMGLSAYGKPIYKDKFYNGFETKLGKIPVLLVEPTGLFKSPATKEIYGRKLTVEDIFGKSETYDSIPGQYQTDIAATLQAVTNDIFLKLARYAREITGEENLVLCGGVAMNGVANGVVERSGIFKNVFLPSNASDNGASLGAALYVYNLFHKKEGDVFKVKSRLPYTSCAYKEEEIREAIKSFDLPFRKSEDIVKDTASELSQGKIVGWFQDKLELGARALGNRSILSLPFPKEMKDKVNLKVKFREWWRPFAPVIKEDKVGQWFEGNPKKVPFMTATYFFKKELRGKVGAVIHEDGSGRLQTCSLQDNPRIYRLLTEIEKETSVPILLNTSFNIKGMPIVATPEDAILCYLCNDIDVLVIGDFIVKKTEHSFEKLSRLRVSHQSRFIEMTLCRDRPPVFLVDGSEEADLLRNLLAETLDREEVAYRICNPSDKQSREEDIAQLYLVSNLKDPYREFNYKLKGKLIWAYRLIKEAKTDCYLLNFKGSCCDLNQLFSYEEWEEIAAGKDESLNAVVEEEVNLR